MPVEFVWDWGSMPMVLPDRIVNVAGIPVLNLAMDSAGNMGLLVVNEEGMPRVVSGVGSDRKRTDLYSNSGFRVFSAANDIEISRLLRL